MKFIWTTDLTSTTYHDALAVRKEVFIVGQGVDAAIEIDALESSTEHVTGYLNGEPVAAARLNRIQYDTYKVQRVAVLSTYRGQHLGEKLMQEIERYAIENDVANLVLGAQDHAIGFYEKLGYTVDGDGFMEANIPHHMMRKQKN